MENEITEETQEASTEDVKTEDNQGQEETKDWKAEALKYKAIAERKDKKLQEQPQGEVITKSNTEQGGPTLEDMVLVKDGFSIEEIKVVKEGAKVLNLSPLEASKHDIIQAKIEKDRQAAQVKVNQLPPSGGSAPVPREKEIKNMTQDEHADAFAKAVNGL